MALAHLLCKYGRKILESNEITLLHFDHGWRKESADSEKKLVENLAKNLGVKFLHQKLPEPVERLSRNLEEDGRLKRQAAYEVLQGTHEHGAYILTAHHENDAVETIFWRFLRGEFDEYREGILFHYSEYIRPFIKVKKKEILAYARAEKVEFLHDPTNDDSRYFRVWMRKIVFPLLETQFPQVQKVLARYLTKGTLVPIEKGSGLVEAVQIVTGEPLNRAQRKSLHELTLKLKLGACLSLPDGKQIRRLKEGFLIETID